MKGSISAVMCLAKVKSIVVPFNVVDLETFDTQSRLYEACADSMRLILYCCARNHRNVTERYTFS